MVLSLEVEAELEEINKRFTDLSKQLHLDMVEEKKKKEATAKWVAVKVAYDLLQDLALVRLGGRG